MQGKLIRIPALTGVRFLAAISVLFAHLCPAVVFSNTLFNMHMAVPLALFGMSLFFVLSGFVIYLNYNHLFSYGNFWAGLRNFTIARVARLYPLYIFFVFIAVATQSWDLPANKSYNFILLFPLMQTWLPGANNEIYALGFPRLAHAWSISTEMFFYCCFPLILVFQLRRHKQTMTSNVQRAVLYSLFTYVFFYYVYKFKAHHLAWVAPGLDIKNFTYWLAYLSPYTRVFEFITGCMAAKCYHDVASTAPNLFELRVAKLLLMLVMAAILVLMLVIAANYDFQTVSSYWQYLRLNFVMAPLIGYMLFHVCRYESLFKDILSVEWIVLGGELSYSMYLLHPFIAQIFIGSAHPVFSALSALEWLFRISAALAFIGILSWGSYNLIEVPARKWIRDKLISPTKAKMLFVPGGVMQTIE